MKRLLQHWTVSIALTHPVLVIAGDKDEGHAKINEREAAKQCGFSLLLDAIARLSFNGGNAGSDAGDAAGDATARFHLHKRGDVLHRPR